MGRGKTKTTEEFIADARRVHGDRYGYEKVVYKNSRTKVSITCPVHGDFDQLVSSHLSGCGCSKCKFDAKRLDSESFVKRAIEVHGEKYGYDKVVYKNSRTKVSITCPVHGDFDQEANSHLCGCGCSKCRDKSFSSNTESFIKRAVEVHGDKYGYDKVVYDTNNRKVTITCPVHGDFEQIASSHLSGRGCTMCFADSIRSNSDFFIKRAVEVHGEKYGYDKVVYVGSDKKVVITCPVHGDFEQTPNHHTQGGGCPKCIKNWSGDGVVYVMSMPEGHNKIGIAKSGTEHKRLQQIFMSAQQHSPTSLTDLELVCAYSFNDGSFTEARRFEGKAHRYFKARRKQFTEKFDGSSEFFTVPVSEICQYLEQQGGKLVTVVSAP